MSVPLSSLQRFWWTGLLLGTAYAALNAFFVFAPFIPAVGTFIAWVFLMPAVGIAAAWRWMVTVRERFADWRMVGIILSLWILCLAACSFVVITQGWAAI